MSIYRFVLCGPGAAVEELGSLLLRDDSEAVAFGQSVVRDMVQGASPQQAAVVEVIDGERTVSRIDRDEPKGTAGLSKGATGHGKGHSTGY
jgi:hypothetical protein